jgi:ABC-type transport system substrate-binding protein
LDPADSAQANSILLRNVSSLIFDTLVILDDRGSPQPELAVSWTSSSAYLRWQFELRHGVTFSDGSPLTSDIVAASLRKANPNWKVVAASDSVIIELESPVQNFPAQLAVIRNSIVRRDSKLLGTGPFVISQWDQARRLALVARDDYWGSRAFLDAIQIEGSQSLRDQAIALELGRADLIEVSPEQSKRAGNGERPVSSSEPIELMVLLFAQDPQSQSESRLREALSLSIDRSQLNRVVLQNGGDPAGSLLPNWMTGYGFLFPLDRNLSRAKQLRSEAAPSRSWTLTYDSGDALAHVVAERVILNARDAGLNIQLTSSPSADIRLVRIPLASLDSRTAFAELAGRLRVPLPKMPVDSADGLYLGESALLQSRRTTPLLHLRYVSGVGANVHNWSLRSDGSWRMPQVWLSPQQP